MLKTVKVLNSTDTSKPWDTLCYGTYGPLMVTREVDKVRHWRYVVTHKATGAACRHFRHLSNARKAAIAWRGLDWDIKPNEVDVRDDRRKALHQALIATPEWSAN